MQSFLIFFIKFAIVSFAVAAMIMYLLNFIKMWIEKERKSWDASGHSPECEYDIEYFETMFKDHDIPLDGTRWKVPEGFRINVSLNNGIVVKIYPGDEISAREDSLAVYRKVYRKVETNSGLFEHINTYCDWDGINSIQAVSPFKTASELLDGDDEYVMNELYEARAARDGGKIRWPIANNEMVFDAVEDDNDSLRGTWDTSKMTIPADFVRPKQMFTKEALSKTVDVNDWDIDNFTHTDLQAMFRNCKGHSDDPDPDEPVKYESWIATSTLSMSREWSAIEQLQRAVGELRAREARAVYRALTKEANKCPKCQGRGWYLMGGNDYSKTCECQQQEATDE